jgi:hypothetical protein
MHRDTWVQAAAAACLIGFLAASALLATQVAASAGQHRLSYTDTAEEGDPPEVALGIAMGAFRGLFVNMLWMRANALKEEGKYYEAVDLARMITRLQPRFPRVWVFHAWNLAYNISVATTTPQERWEWVQAGIRLLRDQGIPSNPDDVLLHKELAWIYLHKIQGIMDDANWYYKRQLARDWTIALGPPPRRTAETNSTEAMKQAYVDWLTRIAESKDTLADLVAAVPAVGPLLERFRSEAGLDLAASIWTPQGTGPGEQILAMIEEKRSLERIQTALGLAGRRPNFNPAAVAILEDMSVREPLRALAMFLRKRMVTDKYHMELDRMIRYTREYGPLDWRHAASHAIYWSTRGVEEVMYRINPRNKADYDILNTDRLTIQALQELFRNGEIYFDNFNPDFFMQLPNPDFVDAYEKVLYKLSERAAFSPRPGEWVYPEKGRPFTIYSAGYENFLKDAIRFMYRRGDLARANELYDKLRTFPYLNTNRDWAEFEIDLALPVGDFAALEISKDDRYTSPYVAQGEVLGAIQSALVDGLLAGNMRLFRSQMDYARAFHKIFVDKQVFSTATNRDDRARMEVMDRDFDTYAAKVLTQLVQVAGVPDGAIIYSRCPTGIQTKAYPLLVQSEIRAFLDGPAQAGAGGFDIWFPPPPGLEEYKKQLDAEERARRQHRGTIEQK